MREARKKEGGVEQIRFTETGCDKEKQKLVGHREKDNKQSEVNRSTGQLGMQFVAVSGVENKG